MSIHYDKKNDVLYISFGKPRQAVCVEKEPGLLIRYSKEKEIIGVTLMNLKEKLKNYGHD